MNRGFYKKLIPILAIAILLAVFVPQHQAQAFWPFSQITQSTVGTLITDVTAFIRQIVLAAIGWAASLLDTFIQSQPVSGVFVVDQSWRIVRDFVNMFFILVLIAIAFGTIFDIQGYSWNSGRPPVLVTFIIAALLINFSLVIGQYVIGVANGLNGVFLKSIGAGQVSGTFMTGLNSVGLKVAGGTNLVDTSGSLVITAIFSIIFLVIVFLAFLSVAIFSLCRIVVLWFLLIISPIAWLGYALPNLRGQTWSAWWKHFFCWCFFLPYYTFFLMFAVMFIRNKDALDQSSALAAFSTNSSLFGGGFKTVNDLLFYTLSLVFLIGGLIAAMKLSCATGSGVKMVFGKIEGGVRKYAPGAAYVRGAWGGVKARGEEIKEKGVLGVGGAQRARIAEARAKGLIAGIPGLGRVPGAREEASRAMSAEVDKETKRLQTLNLTLDQLNERLAKASGPEKLAAFKIKAENGWLEPTDLNEINGIMREAGGGGTALGASVLQSLKKGKFHEMARSTSEKERIFAGLRDLETKKAFGLDMAESREIMNEALATQLLGLYEGDALETRKKVEEAIKNNIENLAKEKSQREAILTRPATTNAEKKLKELTAKTMVDKKEIDSWKLRRLALDAVGGMDSETGDGLTAEGRELAKNIKDGNIAIKEEADYRKSRAMPSTADLSNAQQTELENQIIENVQNKLITGFGTEELQTPAIFNSLYKGVQDGRITVQQFDKLTGLATGKGKPDRKKREAGRKIAEAAFRGGRPMTY